MQRRIEHYLNNDKRRIPNYKFTETFRKPAAEKIKIDTNL